LEEQGNPDEAIREIELALKLDPESWEVNREAARLLFRLGRTKDAVPYFEKAASLMDTDWHNPAMLMTCYNGSGEAENLRRAASMTIERAEKALAKDPANAPALASGSSALAALGERDRAMDWLERALLLDPDNILMRYNLACALTVDLHDDDRALEVMREYFERTVSPTHIRHADADPDLDRLRVDPRFTKMVHDAKKRLGMPAAEADA